MSRRIYKFGNKHSPTPWAYSIDSTNYPLYKVFLEDMDGKFIAEVDVRGGNGVENAELIINAVNKIRGI